MEDQFIRTKLLLGEEPVNDLAKAHVIVFGVGGVGGFAVEALVRSGIGKFTLVDKDEVDITNLNRQIIATHENIGKAKVEVAKERILSINPNAQVEAKECFFLPDNANDFDFREYDYVIDAVDTVTAKLLIAQKAYEAQTPIMSSMGAGNKVDPTQFEVADINETSICPLARTMRKELRKRGVPKLKVVYSKEPALKPLPLLPMSKVEETGAEGAKPKRRKATPGSVAWSPSVAGLIIAGEAIKDLAGFNVAH